MGKNSSSKAVKRKKSPKVDANFLKIASSPATKRSKLGGKSTAMAALVTEGKQRKQPGRKLTKTAKTRISGDFQTINNNAQVAVTKGTVGKSPIKSLRSRSVPAKQAADLEQVEAQVHSQISGEITGEPPVISAPSPKGVAPVQPSSSQEPSEKETTYDRIYRKAMTNLANRKAQKSAEPASQTSAAGEQGPKKGHYSLDSPGRDEITIAQDGMKMAVTASDEEFFDSSDDSDDILSDDQSLSSQSSSSSDDSTVSSDDNQNELSEGEVRSEVDQGY